MPLFTRGLLHRVPLLAVAVMLALVPLVTGNLTGLGIGSGPLLYDTIALPRLVIAMLLTLTAWTAWFATAGRRGEPLRVDLAWAFLGGLSLWAAVSLAFSPHRALGVLGQSERLEGLVMITLYALLYGLALQVVKRIGDARVLLMTLGGATVLLSLYGVAQFLGLDPFDYSIEGYSFETRRAFATFGNPNFFANLLVLVLPALGALAIRSRSQAGRIAWSLGAVLVAATLFMTFTRGAWLGAAAQIVFGTLVLWRMRKTIAWRTLRVPVAVGVAAFVALLAFSLGATGELNVVQRTVSAIERTGSAGERELLAATAVSATMARPITGYGPDAFLPAFRMHRPDDYVISFGAHPMINNAHSWPLQIAATLGVPGAMALVGAVMAVLIRARRRVFAAAPRGADRSRDDEELSAARADLLMPAAWVGCAGFALAMVTGVAVPGAVLPFWVLLGIVAAPHARPVALPASVGRNTVFLCGVLTLLVAVASLAIIRADVAYLQSRNVYRGLATGDPAEFADTARSLNPLSVKYARGMAEVVASRVDSAIATGSDPESVRVLYDLAAEEFEWVLRQSPNDYPAHAWLAALQARTGRYLGDDSLLREAQATAQAAGRLDRQGEQVFGLATGDMSDASIGSASAVWPLP